MGELGPGFMHRTSLLRNAVELLAHDFDEVPGEITGVGVLLP